MSSQMDPLKRLLMYKNNKKTLDPEDVDVVPVTLELAHQYDSMAMWKGERLLSSSRMAYLLDSIPKVSLPFLWYSARVKNVVYRMNGQNTSRLFVERPGLIRKGMVAVISKFRCMDDIEAAWLYSSIDNRISSRSANEVNNSFRGGHPRLSKHSKATVSLCSAGIRMSVNGVDTRAQLSAIDRGELLLNNLDFIDDVSSIVMAKNERTKHIWRAPVVYGMHKTYPIVDRELFFKFWEAVRDGDDVRGTMPDLLREYLIATGLGGTTARRSKVHGRHVMCEKIIKAWNAWRESKSYISVSRIVTTNVIPPVI